MRRISILNKQIYYVCCGFPIITLMSLYRDIYIGLWDSNGLLLVQSLSELQAHFGQLNCFSSNFWTGFRDIRQAFSVSSGEKKKRHYFILKYEISSHSLGCIFFFFLPLFFPPFFFFLECLMQLCNSFEFFNHLWIHHSEIVYEFVTQK